MATQKLFGDVPSGFSGIAGMVSPNITADITQKNAEDDASTLAGYKKRLELQSGQEASAYQNKLNYQRQLQQQWEQEDLKKQADQMRQLDTQRQQAFDVLYRPQVTSQLQTTLDNSRAMAAAANPQVSNQQQMHLGDYTNAQGYTVTPGQKGAVGRPQPSSSDVQAAMNMMYGRNAAAQAAQNTNPYYNPIVPMSSGGPRRGAAGQLL
jgi:hypothetical protein